LEAYGGQPIPFKGKIVVKAFNKATKDAGFFLLNLDKDADPVQLSMTPHKYQVFNVNAKPIELISSKAFVVKRENEIELPNYFLTHDFKNFIPLTDVEPQRSWNWMTAELHSFKSLSGRDLKGVLYKPENFDPQKKYPVIVHIYSNMSDDLHKYRPAEWTTDHMNIPWFVSNGYLVFTPDIHYKLGDPAESAFECTEGAAQYLKALPFIDAKCMGLQGQSFGGYETNFIVTQSSSFAAAMASSGPTDIISGYNSDAQGFIETGQVAMFSTLWERPDLYIKNSPVFYVHRVQTPLLMMNNKADFRVVYSQGIEFFDGLRRLGKRVWLLQYDNGTHVVTPGSNDALQHTIRITQFFDHYLKDSACPRWMLYGIPPEMKGYEDGLELVREKDPKTGKWITPKEGNILTDEEKIKVEALKKRKPINIAVE
jgi:dipeptidyl aminopeptidase/acylaminoacyl peptidase